MEILQLLESLQNSRKALLDKKDSIYIVNAGIMNQGKSSLFNSLLNSKELATGDKPITKTCTEIKVEEGVYFIDTPGLGAEDADDTEAQKAYKKANMIIFVHSTNVGELHADELDWINHMAKLAPSPEYFWNHFCIVLTFREAVGESDLEHIKIKIQKDLKKGCGEADVLVFFVSNLRYQKGKDRKQETFIKESGIQELREFLKNNIKVWQAEAKDVSEKQFEKIKGEILDQLLKEQNQLQEYVQEQEAANIETINRLRQKIGEYNNVIGRIQEEYEQAQCQKQNLNKQVKTLQQKHRRAVRGY